MAMEDIVALVRKRAQHLLDREAKVGSSTPSLAIPKNASSSIKPDRIHEDELVARLLRLDDHLEEYDSVIEAAALRVAARLHPKAPNTVLRLAPEEITSHWDGDGNRVVTEKEVAELAALIVAMRDHGQHASYELKRLISGHYGAETRRGRSATRRGKEVGAMLFGYAVGLGLKPTSQKAKAGQGSAIEAVTTAVRSLSVPDDPAAKAVFDQLPRGYDPLANLNQQLRTDEALRRLFEANRQRGARDNPTPN